MPEPTTATCFPVEDGDPSSAELPDEGAEPGAAVVGGFLGFDAENIPIGNADCFDWRKWVARCGDGVERAGRETRRSSVRASRAVAVAGAVVTRDWRVGVCREDPREQICSRKAYARNLDVAREKASARCRRKQRLREPFVSGRPKPDDSAPFLVASIEVWDGQSRARDSRRGAMSRDASVDAPAAACDEGDDLVLCDTNRGHPSRTGSVTHDTPRDVSTLNDVPKNPAPKRVLCRDKRTGAALEGAPRVSFSPEDDVVSEDTVVDVEYEEQPASTQGRGLKSAPPEPPESLSDRQSAFANAPRLSRQKSWGSAKIARLDAEAKVADAKHTKRKAQRRQLPLLSKLRYVLLCGEPILAERMLSQRLTRQSTLAAMSATKMEMTKIDANRDGDKDFDTHWWMIHPFSHFRRRWDLFVVAATAYVALLSPFVIGAGLSQPQIQRLFADCPEYPTALQDCSARLRVTVYS